MTKSLAEKIVKGITDKIEATTFDIDDWAEFWGFTRKDYEEFLEMSVKTIEQELILDKIYMDIQSLRGCSCDCSDGIVDDIEDIIDKYRA